ncbi:MAG: D-alanyl-D-alanine carboxypeptidase [Clostridia bacterium]|nr:D-alanyl-D-alanine carboxypeptidase [Clostridia bacterium]
MSFLFLKKCLIVLLCIAMVFSLSAGSISAKEDTQNENMKFDCKSAVLMEAATGTVLYEYNPDLALPPASVTKIMTLLLIMEEIEKGNLKYTDTITTSAYAASMGGSQVFLKEGEQMSAEDMIKSVVIASANDAAVALAEHICGSEQIFVQRMNEKARELGMENTYFENTNGLDDTATNHLTSAIDIAIMSRELIKHEDILKYSSIWMDTIRNGEFGLTNTNRLVRFYQGATGLKTGSTSKAKFCISATAKRGNMHLICVIMGANSSAERNSIATQLLNWGFANFELYQNSGENLEPIKVTGGTEDKCHIYTEDFACVVKKGNASKIEKRYEIPDKVNAPLQEFDEIGKILYYHNNEIVGESSVLSCENIEKIDFWGLFVRILSKILLK